MLLALLLYLRLQKKKGTSTGVRLICSGQDSGTSCPREPVQSTENTTNCEEHFIFSKTFTSSFVFNLLPYFSSLLKGPPNIFACKFHSRTFLDPSQPTVLLLCGKWRKKACKHWAFFLICLLTFSLGRENTSRGPHIPRNACCIFLSSSSACVQTSLSKAMKDASIQSNGHINTHLNNINMQEEGVLFMKTDFSPFFFQ